MTSTRPFTPRERALLEHICSAEHPNAAIARVQLRTALHAGASHGDDLCFDIAVAEGVPAITGAPGPWVSHEIYDSGEFIGWITLEFSEGVMSAVDYTWVSDQLAPELPEPSQLTPAPDPANVPQQRGWRSRLRRWADRRLSKKP